jgi:hypothetical protein
VRGTDRSFVAWNVETLDALVEAALLRYLADAHFGRGRGDWQEGEAPAHWKEVVAASLAPWREVLAAVWAERALAKGDAARDAAEALLVQHLLPIVRGAAWSALRTLYPDADMAPQPPDNARPAGPPTP